MMKISVITVVLNAATTIERCLKSVKNQTHGNIELIVIDGGSTDGTLDIIGRYRSCITYFISEPDRGLYHAMNKGIKVATGEYIYFLNSDDYFCDDDVVNDVVSTINQESAPAIIYGNVLIQDGAQLSRKTETPILNRESFCRNGLCHQALFAHRNTLVYTSGFSEDYRIVADGDWLARTIATGARSLHIERDIATISMEGLSSTSNWRDEKRRCLRTHYTRWELFRWRKLPGIIGRKKNSGSNIIP
jgi:glycosyltransferase involved in cell wall biosynthesis